MKERLTIPVGGGFSIKMGKLFPPEKSKNKDKDPRILVIKDEKAQFIRLFGIMVDMISGNIAYGMFPDSYEYICIGNIFKDISQLWFNTTKVPNGINMSYIIELMKMEPDYYNIEIQKEVLEGYEKDFIPSSESILLELIRNSLGKEDSELDTFKGMCNSKTVISKVAAHCIQIFLDCESVAKELFESFITEQSDDIVSENAEHQFNKQFMREGNLESLTLKYVMEGYPEILLQEAKSYGYRLKERKALFSRGISPHLFRGGNSISKGYTNDELVDIGKALSSMYYVRKVLVKEKQLAYNFIDMMRSIGWEHNIYFALDTIVEFQSKTLWESIMNRFHMYDIFKELNLSEKEFVIGISEYRNAEMSKVSQGACYGRFTTFPQYKFLSYSIHQTKEAGMIFESTFNMLKKFL